MPKQPQHFGWPVSPYSAKTRAYLRYKRIPFADRTPNIFTLRFRVMKNVGKFVMPTVERADGSWLQDTSDIIDAFETESQARSIIPEGPRQRLGSAMMELYADEWLPMVALHYRWNVPENRDFALREFARYALPGLPTALGRLAVGKTAQRLRGYLPLLGVTRETQEGVERHAKKLIAELEVHFQVHEFLFGSKPCLGDFALFGPLYAHLYRDVGSTYLFADAPSVVKWFDRLRDPAAIEGDFLSDDAFPPTLAPIFETILTEQMPFISALVRATNEWGEANRDAKRLPKTLGETDFQIGGIHGERKLITFVQWKAQRPYSVYRSLTPAEKRDVDTWLTELGNGAAFEIPIKYPIERIRFRPYLMNR